MPTRLKEIFDGTDIDKLDQGVVLKAVLPHIKEIPKEDVDELMNHLPPDGKLIVMKKRCDVGDKFACMAYDVVINGDMSAPAGSPKHLGLKGLWYNEKNETAKMMLEKVGEL